MSERTFDVAVIGGGLHGLSAALHLARRRKRVAILEKSWIGRHSSGATAAGVRTLNRDHGELDLALEAMDMWHNMESLVGDDCGFHPFGQICVAERVEHLRKLEQRVESLTRMGYRHERIIDPCELRQLVPAISPHCVGASIAPDDGSADPHRTIAAFRRSAESAGVVIYEGCGVEAIEGRSSGWTVRTTVKSFNVPCIVNAAGAWAGRVATMVGDDIPLGTKASMMMVSERMAPLIKPVVSVIGRNLSFKQSDQGTLIIGGGLQGVSDLDAETADVRFGVLAAGAKAATDFFPCVRDVRLVRAWAGLEAKTADMLPVVGPSVNAAGVFHAFGYSGHGFELVPVVGAVMADLVVDGATSRPIGALNAERLMVRPSAPSEGHLAAA